MEPELGPLDYYLKAFSEIATARPTGLGASQIPWHSIVDYYKVFIDPNANIENKDFAEFYYIMRLIDNKVMELHEKRNKAKTPPPPKGER